MKKAKIDLLNSQYDSFHMLDCESNDDILTQFTNITNGLVFLGIPVSNDQKVFKIIRALPVSGEIKAIKLKKLNDNEEMNFTDLVRNLKKWSVKQEMNVIY